MDKTAIQAIQENDTAGIKELYKQYLPRIASFISSNGGSFDDARDIFQDALVLIYQKSKQEDFELTSSFYTLLYGVCRNLWGNQLQKKSRTEVRLTEDKDVPIDESISGLIEQGEQRKVFWEAFKKLGKDCQKILELFFAKVRMAEIVDRLSLSSVSNAKKKKFQCKEKLVKLVKADRRFKELNYK